MSLRPCLRNKNKTTKNPIIFELRHPKKGFILIKINDYVLQFLLINYLALKGTKTIYETKKM
jgi:hypothetical protein